MTPVNELILGPPVSEAFSRLLVRLRNCTNNIRLPTNRRQRDFQTGASGFTRFNKNKLMLMTNNHVVESMTHLSLCQGAIAILRLGYIVPIHEWTILDSDPERSGIFLPLWLVYCPLLSVVVQDSG